LIRHHRIAYGLAAQLRKTEKIVYLSVRFLGFSFQGFSLEEADGEPVNFYLQAGLQGKGHQHNISDIVTTRERGFSCFCQKNINNPSKETTLRALRALTTSS